MDHRSVEQCWTCLIYCCAWQTFTSKTHQKTPCMVHARAFVELCERSAWNLPITLPNKFLLIHVPYLHQTNINKDLAVSYGHVSGQIRWNKAILGWFPLKITIAEDAKGMAIWEWYFRPPNGTPTLNSSRPQVLPVSDWGCCVPGSLRWMQLTDYDVCCIYVFISVYSICIHICVYVFISVYMYIYIYAFVYIYVYV